MMLHCVTVPQPVQHASTAHESEATTSWAPQDGAHSRYLANTAMLQRDLHGSTKRQTVPGKLSCTMYCQCYRAHYMATRKGQTVPGKLSCNLSYIAAQGVTVLQQKGRLYLASWRLPSDVMLHIAMQNVPGQILHHVMPKLHRELRHRGSLQPGKSVMSVTASLARNRTTNLDCERTTT